MDSRLCGVVADMVQLAVAHHVKDGKDYYIVFHKGTHHWVAPYTDLQVAVNFAKYADVTFDFDDTVQKIVNGEDVSEWESIYLFLSEKRKHVAFAHDLWSEVVPTTRDNVRRAVQRVRGDE